MQFIGGLKGAEVPRESLEAAMVELKNSKMPVNRSDATLFRERAERVRALPVSKASNDIKCPGETRRKGEVPYEISISKSPA
jgi:hypothetical protein